MNAYWMAAVVSLWILLTAVGVAQVGLLRRVSPLLAGAGHDHGGPHGLPAAGQGIEVGAAPAEFRATTASGEPAGLASLLGQPTVALLTSGGCMPCEQLIAELEAGGTAALPARLVLIVGENDDPAALRLPASVGVIRQLGGSAASAFAVAGTPYAFALDAAGVVRARGIPGRVADLAALAAALLPDGQLTRA